jgi:hypothetical protein
MGEVVRRDEVAAALGARRELGAEYEDEVVDALVAKIEKRLEERRPAPVRREEPWRATPMIASLGIAIPLLGIAGGTAGVAGIALISLAIVLVNYFYYRR